jgi:hypothetical protein
LSSKHYVSCSELQVLKHADFADGFIINLICTKLDTTTYQALRSANLRLMGWTNDAHLQKLAFVLIATGRVPKGFRQYFIRVLCGSEIFYTDEDGTKAARFF